MNDFIDYETERLNREYEQRYEDMIRLNAKLWRQIKSNLDPDELSAVWELFFASIDPEGGLYPAVEEELNQQGVNWEALWSAWHKLDTRFWDEDDGDLQSTPE